MLNEIVEFIDNANDLHTLGGFQVVIDLLKHDSSDLRQQAAWVLATCVQNNTKCQKQLLELDGIKILLNMLQTDPNAEVRNKVLLAISGFLKHNPVGCSEFFKLNGLTILANSFSHNNSAYSKKLVFLLNNLLIEMPKLKLLLLDPSVIKSILVLLQSEDLDLLEKTLHLLQSINDGLENKGVLQQTTKEALQQTLARVKIQASTTDHHNSEWVELIEKEITTLISNL